MIPKEKAKDLISQFIPHCNAKQCALKIVKEFQDEYSGYRVANYLTIEHALELRKYWDDVEKELQEL